MLNNYFQDLPGDELRGAICVMEGDKNNNLSGYAPVKGGLIAFNTMVDCKEPLSLGIGYRKISVPPKGLRVIGNLIVNKRAGAKVINECNASGCGLEENVVSGKVKLNELPGLRKQTIKMSDIEYGYKRPVKPVWIQPRTADVLPKSDIHELARAPRHSAGSEFAPDTDPVPLPQAASDAGPRSD